MKTQIESSAIFSQAAEALGYTHESAVQVEDLLAEQYGRREKVNSRRKWQANLSKKQRPAKFYVVWVCKSTGLNINTKRMGKRGLKNMQAAMAIVMSELRKKIPNYKDLYTFEYSFVQDSKGNDVMVPSLRIKSSEESKFYREHDTVRFMSDTELAGLEIMKAQAEAGGCTFHIPTKMTNAEVEGAIIDGEFDGIDPHMEEIIAQGEDSIKKATKLRDVLYQTAKAKQSGAAWDNWRKQRDITKRKLNILRSMKGRKYAYMHYESIEEEYNTQLPLDGLRDARELTETEAAYRSAFMDNQGLQDALMDKKNPTITLDEKTLEVIWEADISEHDLGLICLDIIGPCAELEQGDLSDEDFQKMQFAVATTEFFKFYVEEVL